MKSMIKAYTYKRRETSQDDVEIETLLPEEESSQNSESLAEEKRKLFKILESFFAKDGYDFKYDELFDVFEYAYESGINDEYTSLLEKLYRSKLKFPEFSITKANTIGGRYRVQFECHNEEGDAVTTETFPPRDVGVPHSFSLIEEVNELRKEIALYKSMVHFDHSTLQTQVDMLDQQQQDQHSSHLDTIASVRAKLYGLIFDTHKKNEIVEVDKFPLPEDAFAFIMYSPCGLPGFTAWMIFSIQITTYVVTCNDEIGGGAGNDFEKSPFVKIPLGAKPLVHVGQVIAIFLIFLVEDGLWESSIQLMNGFHIDTIQPENNDEDEEKVKDITYFWWLVSNLLRFVQGLAATLVIFILIILSDNIVTLFKDFTAMTFISSLDNVVFELASMSVLGKTLKDATECNENYVVRRKDIMIMQKIEKSKKRDSHRGVRNEESDKVTLKNLLKNLKRMMMKPITLMSVLMLIIYVAWYVMSFRPQMRGEFLCQQLYVQLDDSVHPKLQYFTGTYNIVLNNKFGGRPKYVEKRRNRHDKSQMEIKFCGKEKNWVFTKDDCETDVWVKSGPVDDEMQYDLFKVPLSDWSSISGGPRGKNPSFLTSDLRIFCMDKGGEGHGTSCSHIEIDERAQFGLFQDTKIWSDKFSMLNESVYETPAYYSNNENEFQYVIFVGKRWGMFSKAKKDTDNPGTFFEEPFHLLSSNITFSFFSETVDFSSAKSTGSPTNLKWYLASNPTAEGQKVEMNSIVTSVFICSNCSNTTNPCFFGGTCNSNQKCTCDQGSTGTLCQVVPTGDGKCDPYFNEMEYNYDGGDCCEHTCVSTKDHICGRDFSKQFYIGYDSCCVKKGTCKTSKKDTFSAYGIEPYYVHIGEVSQLSLNPNGRTMAVINPRTRSVNVYDNDGKNWLPRGSSLARLENVNDALVQVASSPNILNNFDGRLSPVTVALMTGKVLSIFDWKNNIWEETLDFESDVKHMEMQNYGSLIGVLYHSGVFKVFQRDFFSKHWDETREHSHMNWRSMTMSSKGDVYVLANNVEIMLFTESGNHNFTYPTPGEPIRTIAMSKDGTVLTVLAGKPKMKGVIVFFDITDSALIPKDRYIRGIPSGDTDIQIFGNGSIVVVQVSNVDDDSINSKGLLLFFEWNGDRWIETTKATEIKQYTLSEDEKTFVTIPFTGESGQDSIKIYRNNNHCGHGGLSFHVTVNLDLFNKGVSWEIIDISPSNKVTLLKRGGPYPSGSTSFAEDLCISRDYIERDENEICIVMRITDFELDGLTPPGSFGFFRTLDNGTSTFKTIDSTIGYQDVKHLVGSNESCVLQLIESSPWETGKYSFDHFEYCTAKDCEWIQVGNEINAYTGFFYVIGDLDIASDIVFGTPHCISSDGSILALSTRDSVGNKTSFVTIFKYEKSRGWVQHGNNITAREASEFFGWSKSLSADGYTIAIGDPKSNINGVNSGQVYVFAYNKEQMGWYQLGRTINGTTENLNLGQSVSLSADGYIVAMGSSGSNHEAECNVYVYNYDESKQDWSIQGQCIDVRNETLPRPEGIHINLSSSGLSLVIGVSYFNIENQEISGHVLSYQYISHINRWEKVGQIIHGQNTYKSVSISADGSIIAMSGSNGYPAKAFRYSAREKEWKQLGKDIDTAGLVGYTDIILSNNGQALVLSMVDNFKLYIYDKLIDEWFVQNYESENLENTIFHLSVSASADVVTVAVENKDEGKVVVYRLNKVNTRNCRSDEVSFNFTIMPDSFPQDIKWEIHDLSEFHAWFLIPDDGSYQYGRCLSKNTTYMFAIFDDYGDGLCCDWGDGRFQVEYDNKVMVDSTNFTSHKYACLTTSNDVTFSKLDFANSNQRIERKEVIWALMSQSKEKVADEKTVLDSKSYAWCVEQSQCFTFASNSPRGEGANYSISFGNETFHNVPTDYFISKTKIGNCEGESTKTCSNGTKLFELDLFTDMFPYETTWDFNEVGLTNLPFHATEEIVEFQRCISLAPDECASFVILDHWGDGGVSYSVTYDGHSFSGFTSNAIITINFGENCRKSCDEGEGLFEIDFVNKNISSSFSWEITDDQNNTLTSKGNYTFGKHQYDSVCLPVDKCLKFWRHDSKNRRVGDIYRIKWNDEMEKLLEGNLFIDNEDTFQFGPCSNNTS